MKYHEKTLAYYQRLNHAGELASDSDCHVGVGIVGSPLCGDVMKLQLLFDEQDKIIDAKYKVFGCVSAIASMELVAEKIKGMSIEEAQKLTNEEVCDLLELTEIKRHCSVLAKESIDAAIKNYIQKKNNGGKNMFEIHVSDIAIKKLFELVMAHGNDCVGIAIDVSPGGCSGVEYSLAYQMKSDLEKNKLKFSVHNVNFFFDQQFEMLIDGIVINTVENSFGLGFVITNPKQISSCKNCSCRCDEK